MKPLKHPDYYEGTLQVRGGDEKLYQWIHDLVKSDDKAAITKEKIVTNGRDFYVSDQHYLQNLGRQLQHNFAGIMKVSTRLFTQHKMTSKLIYRITVLFKTLGFTKGDTITLYGEEYLVLAVGRKALIKHNESGKKQEISMERLERAKKVTL